MEKKLESIDILKGIAIMMVIIVHSCQMIPGINKYIIYIASYGQMGCQLFFLISGFAICLSWFNMKKEEQDKWNHFYKKRFISIAPGYYVMILVYFVLGILFHTLEVNPNFIPNRDWASIVINFLFLHGVVPFCNNNVVPGGWFVGTIMLMYLIFPIIISDINHVYNIKKNTINYWPIMFLLISVIVQSFIAFIKGTNSLSGNNLFLYLSILNQLPCFLVGITLYYNYKNGELERYSRNFSFIIFVILSILAITLFFSGIPMIFSLVPFVSTLSFYWLFIIVNYHIDFSGKNPILRFIGNILKHFGIYSYQAFLVHILFAWYMPNGIVFIITKKIGTNYNGTFLFFILLFFIYVFTYVLARILNNITKAMQMKLKTILF